jgi:predicted Zn finger-like uncharacterized protein
MIVICDDCGTRYNVDISKLARPKITAKCSVCGHLMKIERPDDEKSPRVDLHPPLAADTPSTLDHSPHETPLSETTPYPKTTPAPYRPPRPGIFGKLFSWIFLAILLPLIGIGWTGITLFENQVRFEADRRLSEASDALVTEINRWLEVGARRLSGQSAPPQQDKIRDVITGWRSGRTGFAFLLDADGNIIAHRDPVWVQTRKNLSDDPLIRAFAQGTSGVVRVKNENIEVAGRVQKTESGWLLGLEQQTAEAYEQINHIRRLCFMGLAAAAILALLLSYIIARMFSRPIKQLARAAHEISLGQMDTPIKVTTKDEIAGLGEAFIRMRESLRILMQRAKRIRA